MRNILLSIGSYLPGENGGGPVQSIRNLISATNKDFSYYIFTSNHDFNDDKIYENIESNKWNNMYDANIFYASDDGKKMYLYNILKDEQFSLIFLNDLFSEESRTILYYYEKLKLETPIILMPRGQFNKGALNIKSLKKKIFLKYMNFNKVIQKISFLSTSIEESDQIQKLLKTKKVIEVSNVPNAEKKIALNTKKDDKLKVVFLSRITQKKNLDYALKTLKNCRGNIEFDIYGTLEELKYWEKCKKIIDTLPNNITVTYKGELSNNKVITTLSKYDLFYFPTKSENYGHVISEALQASIPVLISNQTPWTNLEEKKLGWEFPLESNNNFSRKIDELSYIKKSQYNMCKENIYRDFDIQSCVNKESDKYIKVFNNLIEKNE